MEGKKSNVCIRAVSSESLTTAASSVSSKPTSSRSSLLFGKSDNISLRLPGPIFAFQPPDMLKHIFLSTRFTLLLLTIITVET